MNLNQSDFNLKQKNYTLLFTSNRCCSNVAHPQMGKCYSIVTHRIVVAYFNAFSNMLRPQDRSNRQTLVVFWRGSSKYII